MVRRTRTGRGPCCCLGAASGGGGSDSAGPMAMAESGSRIKVDECGNFDRTHDGPGGAGIWLLSKPF